MSTASRLLLASILLCLLAGVLCGCGAPKEDEPAEPIEPAAPAVAPADAAPDVPERFRVTITPAAETYEIPRDLGTVRNLAHYEELTEPQKRQLARVGFVVAPDNAEQMFMLYEDYTETDDAANFITVDSMLQTWHVFFGFSLRTLESEKLAPVALAMTEMLLEDALAQHEAAPEGTLAEAAARNVGYFAVARRLLDPGAVAPDAVADLVEAELALIDEHAGRAESPLLGMTIHYSQFSPRGHYTRTEELARYFRAMMWFGLVGLDLDSRDTEVARARTRQALLITKLLAESEQARSAWEQLYEPIEFFVGGADDLGFREYLPIARGVFGEALPLAEFDSDARLDEFIERARAELPEPGIAPFFTDADASGDLVGEPAVQGRQFRLLGQRFIPDSWVMQQLVSPLVGTPGPDTARDVPMGLDVMAALGSERAREILIEQYTQDRFANYEAQLDRVTAEMEQTPESTWRSNMYWGWLYSLRPLLQPTGAGYPTFMQSVQWLDRNLSTSLASWAELRHDTILYAKQSGAEMGAGPTGAPKGYVEPYPEVFARLAWLAWHSREMLTQKGLLPERLDEPYRKLEDSLLFLKGVAEKQLTGVERTAEEYERIQYFGGEIERLTLDVTEGGEFAGHWFEIQNPTDRNMAAIADVHSFFDSVLQVGVGPAYRIYVVVPHPDGDLQIARGGCFSYFEFHWPASDRLTDEKWQAMLASGEAPPHPEWTESFIVPGGEHHQP
ncbi:MAG: DUF3160 domain-containing protein [Armatimonadota bacterium]|jgi:hypothetical protein